MAKPGALKHVPRDVFAAAYARDEIPLSRIAAMLGVSPQAVSLHAKRLGLPPRGRANKEPSKRCSDAEFAELWRAGVDAADMAHHFGYSHQSCIYKRSRNLGLPRRQRGGKTIPIGEYFQMRLAEKMAREAVAENQRLKAIIRGQSTLPTRQIAAE